MSHIEEVKTEITDLAMILKTCQELGLKGTQNTKLKIYDGSVCVAEVALTDNVGLTKKDAKYSFVGDFWYMERQGTKRTDFINNFTSKYTETKVDTELRNKRFQQTSKTKDKDGNLILKYVRRAS